MFTAAPVSALENCMLVNVTETKTTEDIDAWLSCLKTALEDL